MPGLIPNISVDCVIFGFHEDTLSVLLTKRVLEDPRSGKLIFSDYTLAGHHVQEGENPDQAAARILKEKTGLKKIRLEQFHVFGETDRLENEKDWLWVHMRFPEVARHVFSIAYYSLVDDEKIKPDRKHPDAAWFPVKKLPPLGFDHRKMIEMALEFLQHRLRREPIGFDLLPEKFTIAQVQKLYETILDTQFDKRNFRKKVAQMSYVVPIREKLKGRPHKPAQMYVFSKEVYEKTRTDKNHFAV
jgi:ADP-ribose pyrophosphatase YjhB (NUDIX family)